MLSYMLPVEAAASAEKPPRVPSSAAPGLNLNLTTTTLTNGNTVTTTATSTHLQQHHHHRSCLVTTTTTGGSSMPSKDSSVNSFGSDVTTGSSGAATPVAAAKGAVPTTKMVLVTAASNGGPPHHHQVVGAAAAKHHSLKRVSFGSSKGSMVETLIYESPLQEEPEPSPIPENGTPFPEDGEQTEDERERVRVSFVQHSKPQEVQLPDEPVILSESEFMMAAAAIAESNHVITTYTRQESTESGWDNPFRPGGDLSREADEIVELIKGGKPITPTSGTAPPGASALTVDGSTSVKSPVHESPANKKSAAVAVAAPNNPQTKNGSGTTTTSTSNNATAKNGGTNAAAVNVQRGNVGAGQPPGEVEHVVLKKEKSKCKCCVVQ